MYESNSGTRKMETAAKMLCSFDTIFTADSIESCKCSPYFACGTYQLNSDHEGQKRVGNVAIYQVSRNMTSVLPSVTVDRVHTTATPGILDMKWQKCEGCHSSCNVLSTANANGEVVGFALNTESQEDTIHLERKYASLVEENAICLSLDYIHSSQICVSTDQGNVSLLDPASGEGKCIQRFKAHDFEAWICASDKWNRDVIYSGGDDCKFCGWDIRMGPVPSFKSRHHDMGVCSIQDHPSKENVLCSGSYDEKIRVWDKRNFKLPINVVEVGGGVWRLKWHPAIPSLLLSACMHNGFKIIRFDDTFVSDSLAVDYKQHDSLAYGADWLMSVGMQDESSLVATCSFYDHLLTVWNMQ